MKRTICLLIFLPLWSFAQQKTDHSKWAFGIEQDILPYATGGYFAAVWIGKDHLRSRILLARVNKPDFIIKKGFTNNKVTAYAVTVDYFLAKDWTGWWASSGLVYWKSSIQSDAKLSTAYYNNTLFNGSIGYNWKISKKIYLSPWAGLHLRIAGEQQVKVDNKIFNPPLLNPEASLKLGLQF